MTPADVLDVLDGLEAVEVRAWVEGGWGIDALVGRQTREHSDLDLAVDARGDAFDSAIRALGPLGYRPVLDELPVRLVVDAGDGRSVDLHPVHFQPDGSARQAGHDREYTYPADCFGLGRIADREVPCLSAAIQRRLHSGYEPRAVDADDLAVLAELPDDPEGVVVVSGIPGAGKTTVSSVLAREFRAGAHIEADRLQMMLVSGGRWADDGPTAEWSRQLEVRTRASAALADVWRASGFVPVIDDIYVTRHRLDLLVQSVQARPVRLVVLVPTVEATIARDAARADKTVGERWTELDAVQRNELEGVGLWIDSTALGVAATIDQVLARLDDAVIA